MTYLGLFLRFVVVIVVYAVIKLAINFVKSLFL